MSRAFWPLQVGRFMPVRAAYAANAPVMSGRTEPVAELGHQLGHPRGDPRSHQLVGHYARLLEELAHAHAEPVWKSTRAGRIARLEEEVTDVQRAVSASLPLDEQTDECPRGFAW